MSFMNPSSLIPGADATLASPGTYDLALAQYGGETLLRYNEHIFVRNLLNRRTIMNGRSKRFPRFSGIGAERHQRDMALLGLDSPNTEVEIFLDDRPIVSHFVLDDIDEMILHFEYRSEVAKQQGETLAEKGDELAIRLLINASRTPAPGSVFPGGGYMEDIESLPNGVAYTSSAFPATANAAWSLDGIGAFLQALDDVTVSWDERRIPSGRYALVSVRTWHSLRTFGIPKTAAQMSAFSNGPLFSETTGTYGMNTNAAVAGVLNTNIPDGPAVLSYNGWSIIRSNLAPFGKDMSTDDEVKYRGDFTDTRGILFTRDAVAILDLFSVITESERSVKNRNWLFVTAVMGGGGTLRPENAVELAYSAG